MPLKFPLIRVKASLAALLLIASAQAANVVANPGFEDRLDRWRVQVGATNLASVYAAASFRNTGPRAGRWMLAADVFSTTSTQVLNTGDALIEQALPHARAVDLREFSFHYRGATTSGYLLAMIGFTDGTTASQIVIRYFQTFNNWTRIDLTPMVKTSAHRNKTINRVAFYVSEAWSYSGFALDDIVVDIADPVTIAGRVDLSDFVGDTPPRIDFQLRPVGGGPAVAVPGVALGTDGRFSFVARGLGEHRLYARGGTFLGNFADRNVVLGAGDVSNADVHLDNGDVDGDNAVSIFDYDRFSRAFDSGPGEPRWDPNADLDGDHVVSSFDFDILSRNFDRTGQN